MISLRRRGDLSPNSVANTERCEDAKKLIREVWIDDEAVAARRLNKMRVIAGANSDRLPQGLVNSGLAYEVIRLR